MEFVPGKKITDLSPLARMDFDGAALAEELFRAYLQQILVHGFFHADPHPGNVFITPDYRIALLDLGNGRAHHAALQEDLLQLLLAIAEGRGDEAANIAIKIGEQKEDFEEGIHPADRRDRRPAEERHRRANAGRPARPRSHADAAESGIRVPAELTMLGKTLLNLDQVGRAIAPDFDPNASIRRNAAQIMQQRLIKGLSPGNLFSGVLELKDLIQRLPARLNKMIDAVANNEFKLQVDAIDENTLVEGFQKVANRITVGLILAALIVGAAMLMRVETSFRIWGYPGLAIILFLLAAGGGR